MAALVTVPVREFAHILDVEQGKIRGEAGSHLPCFGGQSEGGRPVDGRRQDRLADAQAQLADRQRENQRKVDRGRRAGIEVRGEGHCGAGVDEGPRRRLTMPPQKEHRSRQERGDRSAGGERLDATLGDRPEVIGADGAEFRGQLGGTGRLELVRVQLELEAMTPGRAEDDARLVGGIDARFTEDVGEGGEPFGGDARQHLIHDERDVLFARARRDAVLDGDLVGAEEGGDEAQRQCLLEAADHAERLDLVVGGEAVARLHLDGGGAARSEAPQARQREGEELVLGARAKVAHGTVDSAAATRDLHVADAGGALFLLLVPRLAEDAVGVRIHEARHEDAATAVHDFRARMFGAHRVPRPDGDDALPLGDNGCSGAHLQALHLGAAAGAGRAGGGDELGDVLETRTH